MSIRAWIVRRKIRSVFRPELSGKGSAAKSTDFLSALKLSEKAIRQPPKTTIVETIDTPYGGHNVRGEWVFEPGSNKNRVILYSHGGGYVWGAPKFYRELAWRLSKACNARVFLLDYSLAPAAKCPVQINEALAAYDMISEANPDARIAMSGDSAGGGLTAALAIAIRDGGRPMPTAFALISPWLDLTGSGDSINYNGSKDVMLRPDGVKAGASMYYGDMSPDDPRCSPLFADHNGLPPILVQVGSEEILLDDSTRFATSVASADGDITLRVWQKMHHVWHMSASMVPEARKAIEEIAAHFEKHWSGI